jgi:hypothetical protein
VTQKPDDKENRGGAKDTIFVPLTEKLSDWFDKPSSELPESIQCLVDDVWAPLPGNGDGDQFWDAFTLGQRRHQATMCDLQNDPSTREEIEREFKSHSEQMDIQREIEDLEKMASPTPLELESKKRQILSLQEKLAGIGCENAPNAEEISTSNHKCKKKEKPGSDIEDICGVTVADLRPKLRLQIKEMINCCDRMGLTRTALVYDKDMNQKKLLLEECLNIPALFTKSSVKKAYEAACAKGLIALVNNK